MRHFLEYFFVDLTATQYLLLGRREMSKTDCS